MKRILSLVHDFRYIQHSGLNKNSPGIKQPLCGQVVAQIRQPNSRQELGQRSEKPQGQTIQRACRQGGHAVCGHCFYSNHYAGYIEGLVIRIEFSSWVWYSFAFALKKQSVYSWETRRHLNSAHICVPQLFVSSVGFSIIGLCPNML